MRYLTDHCVVNIPCDWPFKIQYREIPIAVVGEWLKEPFVSAVQYHFTAAFLNDVFDCGVTVQTGKVELFAGDEILVVLNNKTYYLCEVKG